MPSLADPFALDAREVGEIHRLLVGHALRRAIGEAAAHADIAHGAHLGVGMAGLRTLCAQLCTVVTPALSASARPSRTLR